MNKLKNLPLVVRNISYLSLLQVFNLLLPLVTYPYLISVLGKETYGLVIFAQTIAGYFMLLVDFGFGFSATRDVSISRNDKDQLNKIVSSIFIIKAALFLVSFILFAIVLYIVLDDSLMIKLFLLSMWVSLYDVILPVWYFQGIEKMKYITWLTLLKGLIYLLIFIYIKSSADYLRLPLINGIGALISGSAALFIVFYKEKIHFVFPGLSEIKNDIKKAVPFLLSNISIKIYVSSNKVIVGSFLGMAEVVYYDLSEKVINLGKMPQQIISQSIFPRINREKDNNFLQKTGKLSILINLLIFIAILLAAPYVVNILGGSPMMPAVNLLRLLSVTIPIIALSNIYGIQYLIPFGFANVFSKGIIISAVFFIFLFSLLFIFKALDLYTIAMMTILTEIEVSAYMYFQCKLKKII